MAKEKTQAQRLRELAAHRRALTAGMSELLEAGEMDEAEVTAALDDAEQQLAEEDKERKARQKTRRAVARF